MDVPPEPPFGEYTPTTVASFRSMPQVAWTVVSVNERWRWSASLRSSSRASRSRLAIAPCRLCLSSASR